VGDRLRLVAYLKEEDQGRFDRDWEPTGLLDQITLKIQPNSIDFTELGKIALDDTEATCVFCFGGGEVVRLCVQTVFPFLKKAKLRIEGVMGAIDAVMWPTLSVPFPHWSP